MKNIIIGTAGHVDHGKTALIKALTGIETDRIKEEKKRGITIELGFAYLDLPDGEKAGIIDVPGHEKFVKNMLAGAGGIDLALLVVAADEGFMPQTREHLGILSLLNISEGIIVVTKKDMVDEDWLEIVCDEVRQEVQGTFLENAQIIPVSSQICHHLLCDVEEIVHLHVNGFGNLVGFMFCFKIAWRPVNDRFHRCDEKGNHQAEGADNAGQPGKGPCVFHNHESPVC